MRNPPRLYEVLRKIMVNDVLHRIACPLGAQAVGQTKGDFA
ncbi:hypothetical protein TRICHSKD4_4904 [Roseibium sp. TrichSKD4]|nr:hypothetical protein TRICHSKD4_4904 [Roseibium sp. TrichSKD4]